MEERPFSTPGKRTSMADLDLEVSLVDPAGQATLERCDFETERDLEEIEIRPDRREAETAAERSTDQMAVKLAPECQSFDQKLKVRQCSRFTFDAISDVKNVTSGDVDVMPDDADDVQLTFEEKRRIFDKTRSKEDDTKTKFSDTNELKPSNVIFENFEAVDEAADEASTSFIEALVATEFSRQEKLAEDDKSTDIHLESIVARGPDFKSVAEMKKIFQESILNTTSDSVKATLKPGTMAASTETISGATASKTTTGPTYLKETQSSSTATLAAITTPDILAAATTVTAEATSSPPPPPDDTTTSPVPTEPKTAPDDTATYHVPTEPKPIPVATTAPALTDTVSVTSSSAKVEKSFKSDVCLETLNEMKQALMEIMHLLQEDHNDKVANFSKVHELTLLLNELKLRGNFNEHSLSLEHLICGEKQGERHVSKVEFPVQDLFELSKTYHQMLTTLETNFDPKQESQICAEISPKNENSNIEEEVAEKLTGNGITIEHTTQQKIDQELGVSVREMISTFENRKQETLNEEEVTQILRHGREKIESILRQRHNQNEEIFDETVPKRKISDQCQRLIDNLFSPDRTPVLEAGIDNRTISNISLSSPDISDNDIDSIGDKNEAEPAPDLDGRDQEVAILDEDGQDTEEADADVPVAHSSKEEPEGEYDNDAPDLEVSSFDDLPAPDSGSASDPKLPTKCGQVGRSYSETNLTRKELKFSISNDDLDSDFFSISVTGDEINVKTSSRALALSTFDVTSTSQGFNFTLKSKSKSQFDVMSSYSQPEHSTNDVISSCFQPDSRASDVISPFSQSVSSTSDVTPHQKLPPECADDDVISLAIPAIQRIISDALPCPALSTKDVTSQPSDDAYRSETKITSGNESDDDHGRSVADEEEEDERDDVSIEMDELYPDETCSVDTVIENKLWNDGNKLNWANVDELSVSTEDNGDEDSIEIAKALAESPPTELPNFLSHSSSFSSFDGNEKSDEDGIHVEQVDSFDESNYLARDQYYKTIFAIIELP